MQPERWEKIQDIVISALELEPDERAAFIAESCGDDVELLAEVNSLLRSDPGTSFLQSPPLDATNVGDDPFVGTTVKHYEIIEKLGDGGMGAVYRALDTNLRRHVALKFLLPHLAVDESAEARFLQEARTASGLDHPNICTIHEIGQTEDERTYISMAFYEGETLADKIARGPLGPKEALRYAIQTAEGLERAHEAGIVHRDIKPANLLVTKRDRVKILDFGIAKMTGAVLTRTAGTLGTLNYMSPEQLQGQDLDQRTDVWSLGAVLYEMLTGRRPFAGDYEAALMYAILHQDPDPPTSVVENLPPDLDAVVAKALTKDVAKRYRDCGALLTDLRLLGDGKPPTAELQALSRSRLGPGRRAFVRVSSAVFLLLAVGLSIWFLQNDQGISPSIPAPDAAGTVAVMPLSVSGIDNSDHLGDEIARQLSQAFLDAGYVTSVDYNNVLSLVEDRQGPLDVASAVRVNNQIGSGRFILGVASEVNGALRIEASAYDDAGSLVSRAIGVSKRADVPAIVDTLLLQLLPAWPSRNPFRPISNAQLTTGSGLALREYARAYASSVREEAAAILKRAVELDSTFAYALLVLAEQGIADDREKRLLRNYRERLPDLERLIADMTLDRLPFERINDRFLVLTTTNPNDHAVWWEYANWLALQSYRNGRRTIDAKRAVLRAHELGNHFYMLTQIGKIALLERDYVWLDTLLIEAKDQGMASSTLVLQNGLMSAAAQGDDARLDSLLPHIDDKYAIMIFGGAAKAAMYGQNMAGAKRILDAAREMPAATEYYQDLADQLEGAILVSMGQLEDGHAQLLEGLNERLHPDQLARLTLYSFCEDYPRDEPLWRALKRIAAEWDTTLSRQIAEHYDLYDGRYEELKAYVTALIAFQVGDTEDYRRERMRVERIAHKKGDESLAFAFSKTLSALQHRANGRLEEALAELEVARRTYVPRGENWYWSPIHDQLLDRYLRAEILFAQGRYEEAIPWFFSLNDTGAPTANGMGFIGPAYRRIAFSYEQLGRPDSAIEYYSRVIQIWEDADPALQPYVNNARERFETLRQEQARETGR